MRLQPNQASDRAIIDLAAPAGYPTLHRTAIRAPAHNSNTSSKMTCAQFRCPDTADNITPGETHVPVIQQLESFQP